jgi:Cu/Ag efflux protein CusF
MKQSLYTIAALALAGSLAACGQKADTDSAQAPAPSAAAPASGAPMSGMAPAEMQGAQAAKGTGTVTAIDPAAGTITINHAPIPEANWPAMTMGFKATPEQVGSVKPGDKVAFDLRLQGGAGEIMAISKQ